MSNYEGYPEYRDSGVEWLPIVPSHWELLRLKYSVELTGKKVEFQNGSTYVGLENVSSGDGKRVELDEYIPDGVANTFSVSDVLFGKLRPYLAKVWMADFSGLCSSEFLVMKSRQVFPPFLKYWMLTKDFIDQVNSSTYGSKMPRANWEFVGNLVLPRDNGEQKKIANFLDHETAKIDTLIEKQQQLIKLLKEKRQAVISHAVTKGLNPDAPMKDSGVEWLGEVPEHWAVAQLKFNTLQMQTGPFGSQLHAEDYIDNGVPLVNPAHMSDGYIKPDMQVTVDENTLLRLGRHQLSKGDLIFARRGELGRCAVVTSSEEGWLCGTGSLRATLAPKLAPEYSFLLVTSRGVVSELSLESKGSTMENLNTETLGRVRLPVPPLREQKKILEYVHDESGRYRGIIDRVRSAIHLMRERRTALISAAVTGKIDVRNWQPPVP